MKESANSFVIILYTYWILHHFREFEWRHLLPNLTVTVMCEIFHSILVSIFEIRTGLQVFVQATSEHGVRRLTFTISTQLRISQKMTIATLSRFAIHRKCLLQLWQGKCGIITWVCTNSPTAPTASVTKKLYQHAKLAKCFRSHWIAPKSKAPPKVIFQISYATTLVHAMLVLHSYMYIHQLHFLTLKL